MSLDAILGILTKLNTILPLALAVEKAVMALFVEATPGASNTERIAWLRAAGIDVEARGVEWLRANGLEP